MSAPIRFACENCGTTYMAKFEQAGKIGTCKRCKGTLTVPYPFENKVVLSELRVKVLPPSLKDYDLDNKSYLDAKNAIHKQNQMVEFKQKKANEFGIQKPD